VIGGQRISVSAVGTSWSLTTDHWKNQRMATTAKIAKEEKTPKFKIRLRNRCRLCGRPRGYLRKFDLCRLCFRKLALEGDVTGVTKSSW
jgi:small subunit ribosomal protein S14